MRKFVVKIGAFIAFAAALQCAFYFGVARQRYERQRVALNAIDNHLAQDRQVLFFGDSTVFTIEKLDADMRSLSQMTAAELGGEILGEVAYPAYSLTQFDLFVQYLARLEKKPRVLVMPVNIRSFSASWDPRPDWQFQKEKLFVQYDALPLRVLFDPLVIFKAPVFNLTPIEMGDYMEMPVYNGDQIAGKVKDFYIDITRPPANPDLRRQFIFCYMLRIAPEHRKAQSLRNLIETANKMGVRLVLYITPIDHESGVEMLGPEFDTRLAENVQTITRVVQEAGGTIHDLSRFMSKQEFCPPPFMPNDHLKDVGRRKLAATLAEEIRQALR